MRKTTRTLKRQHELKIASDAKSNPKAFWAYSRAHLKTKSGVAPLLGDPSDLSSIKHNDTDKAEVLQHQFCRVFTREPESDIPILEPRTAEKLTAVEVTPDVVLKRLMKLKVRKSCGPDEIHPRLLCELAEQQAAPLTKLFNKSLQSWCIPRDWKLATVSPIFKKGSKKMAENYRPVSLTSIVCKLLESVVREAVPDHLCCNNLLSNKQFGFIGGRSTTLQLLTFIDECVKTLARGDTVDTVYLDFSKAFDTVPHRRLIRKLEAYGIGGSLHSWISSFLMGRSQKVSVNGSLSSSKSVLSGIPQGSVLGPLLFVIYINDLPDKLCSSSLMFADDTKVFREICSESDMECLQRDLACLERWSDTWLLKFHPDKCKILTVGKLENIIRAYPYRLMEVQLEHVFEEKDLGIIIDTDLTFDVHVSEKIKKANNMLGLIRRSFSCLNADILLPLYKAFVRHLVEYGAPVWSGRLKRSQIRAIEKIQIRATEMIEGMSYIDYGERLKLLHLPTLAYRRARGEIIEVWKHYHVYDPKVIAPTFQRARTRRKMYQIQRLRPGDGVRGAQSCSFYYLAPVAWNNLPASVVESETINIFKNRLDNHWEDHPLRYNFLATTPNRQTCARMLRLDHRQSDLSDNHL